MAKTFIAMIVDETGSMARRRDTAIESTNEFINAHSEIEECYASLVTFDQRGRWGMEHKEQRPSVRFLAEGVAIKEVPQLTLDNYNPYGMTNLYDAIGSTVAHMESVTKHAEDPVVIIMINTDGAENASCEFNGAAIKEIIEEKKEAGWEFVFIGEELDTEQTNSMAQNIGITRDMTINVSGANKKGIFDAMAVATCAYAADAGAAGPRGPAGERGISLNSYMKDLSNGDK